MRAAMAAAEVGDDMVGEDPTVAALETRIATMLGKEAAVFVPSGTMKPTNWPSGFTARPGDELLCEAELPYFSTTSREPTPSSSASRPSRSKASTASCGSTSWRSGFRPTTTTPSARGSSVWKIPIIAAAAGYSRSRWSPRFASGRARTGSPASGRLAYLQCGGRHRHSGGRLGRHFDTVNVCFSKGLGAPVGSALCGSAEMIGRARRHRQALGGACDSPASSQPARSNALNHHVERLAEDHQKARVLADAIHDAPASCSIPTSSTQTS